MQIRLIAKACHEVNRSYCESLGDMSQKPWDQAEKWQQDSAVYGPVKDAAKKEHPCCVPYEELPKEQRTKDSLFQAVVKALS